MEDREVYLTQPGEQFIALTCAMSPAEQRLLERIRRLMKEQCRGCLLMFEAGGFVIYRLSDRNTT